MVLGMELAPCLQARFDEVVRERDALTRQLELERSHSAQVIPTWLPGLTSLPARVVAAASELERL